ELVRTLCFESGEEAASFCRHYGLHVDATDIHLHRPSFTTPTVALTPLRAVTFVESKCGGASIGEVINGGPLPPLNLPTPTNSFDEDGNLKQGSLLKEGAAYPTAAGEGSGVTTSGQLPPPPPLSLPPEMRNRIDRAMVKETARTLLLEVAGSLMREVCREVHSEMVQMQAAAALVRDDVTDEVVSQHISTIAEEVHASSSSSSSSSSSTLQQQQQQQQQSASHDDDDDDAVTTTTTTTTTVTTAATTTTGAGAGAADDDDDDDEDEEEEYARLCRLLQDIDEKVQRLKREGEGERRKTKKKRMKEGGGGGRESDDGDDGDDDEEEEDEDEGEVLDNLCRLLLEKRAELER
ncbi:hypothetical protein Ahia01_001319000, partial [Argonauta hians]